MTHRIVWTLFSFALVIGCGGPDPGAVEAMAEAPPPAVHNEVELDAAALRDSGVTVERAVERSVPEVLRAAGRITLNDNRTWRIGAVTDGRIVSVEAVVGDHVEQGDILARLHSHDIHEGYANYQKAVAELDRLKADLAYARAVSERTRRLHDLKAASLQQVEAADTELRNAEIAVRNGEVDVESTRNHLVDFLKLPVEAAAEHDAEAAHALIPVISPASGTLLRRNVTPGTVVAPSQELFVVTDLSVLWMIAAVDEQNLPSLRVGMPVRLFVQAYPERPFTGRITKLGDELDPTTRTIMARVEVPNASGLLKPEMYATAEMEQPGDRPSIFVPQTAVQEINGQTAVFIRVGEGRFQARPIELGRAIDGSREVLNGLSAGEDVVTSGSFILKTQLFRGTLQEE